jgi:hypothetical protein
MAKRVPVAQVQEVERELAMRRSVYARETKPKKQAENEEHLARMEAVLESLKWLQQHEGKIRRVIAQRRWGLSTEGAGVHPVFGAPVLYPDHIDCCSLCGHTIPDEHSPLVVVGGGRGGMMWAYCAECEEAVKASGMKSKLVEQGGTDAPGNDKHVEGGQQRP